jgi:UDP-glucuronate decarboxylase
VARIFNTYGPRMHRNDGRVVSNFIVQALRGQDITIYGDGQQTRSFCYLDDLLTGILGLMDSGPNFTGPVNIGNPDEFTMLQLAENVLRLTGSGAKLVFKPLPQDDPRQRQPDISLARSILGWQPTVKLEDGLKETIAYFRRLLDADDFSARSLAPPAATLRRRPPAGVKETRGGVSFPCNPDTRRPT